MSGYTGYMSKLATSIRKLAVVLLSLPIFVIGIILIPLPGPGLLICLLGLVVLSLEFESAKKYRDAIWQKIKDLFNAGRQKRG